MERERGQDAEPLAPPTHRYLHEIAKNGLLGQITTPRSLSYCPVPLRSSNPTPTAHAYVSLPNSRRVAKLSEINYFFPPFPRLHKWSPKLVRGSSGSADLGTTSPLGLRNTPKHLINTQQAFSCPVRHPCSCKFCSFCRVPATPASQSSRQNEVDHHVVAVSDEPISRAPCKRDRRSGPKRECIPASQRSYNSSRSPHANRIPPHAVSSKAHVCPSHLALRRRQDGFRDRKRNWSVPERAMMIFRRFARELFTASVVGRTRSTTGLCSSPPTLHRLSLPDGFHLQAVPEGGQFKPPTRQRSARAGAAYSNLRCDNTSIPEDQNRCHCMYGSNGIEDRRT